MKQLKIELRKLISSYLIKWTLDVLPSGKFKDKLCVFVLKKH